MRSLEVARYMWILNQDFHPLIQTISIPLGLNAYFHLESSRTTLQAIWHYLGVLTALGTLLERIRGAPIMPPAKL